MSDAAPAFEDVEIGSELPLLDKGKMSSLHIMRWSAATENWHRIHYDETFAREVDQLPDVLVNGSWKQQVLCQYLKDWAGPSGWLWRIRFRFRDMDVKNTVITVRGAVVEKAAGREFGFVRCSLEMRGGPDRVTTSGEGIVVLPLANGPKHLPYPFKGEECPLEW